MARVTCGRLSSSSVSRPNSLVRLARRSKLVAPEVGEQMRNRPYQFRSRAQARDRVRHYSHARTDDAGRQRFLPSLDSRWLPQRACAALRIALLLSSGLTFRQRAAPRPTAVR